MLQVSEAYKKAILSDSRQFKLRVLLNGKNYTEDDIFTVDWSAGSIAGQAFQIGSTVASDTKITFSKIVEGVVEEQEFRVEIGLALPNGTVEYVPLGLFVITDFDQKRNDNQTVIEGMDRFVMMEGGYESSLTYPARIKDVAVEIANKAGIKFNLGNFSRLSSYQIAKPEKYTFRQAIGLIAQFQAGYATFNRQGELEIRTLADSNYQLQPTNYFSKGLDKTEIMYRLNGIQANTGEAEKETLTVGLAKGNQVILENRVMTTVLLEQIYQKVKDINFFPFNLKWQGDPAVETGDWLTIVDLKGNKFKVPNLTYRLTFKGGLSAQSSANMTSQSQNTFQYSGSLNQKIEEIKGWISADGETWVHEGLDEPLNPKIGDIWFKPNGPDKEIWIYKLLADDTTGWVLEVSTAPNEELLEAIEETNKKTQDAKEAAEKAKDLADNAIPKDAPIKYINESPEMIHVAGDKLHISAMTVFDEAVIKEGYIVDASITNAKIGELAVGTAHIQDASITSAKIKDLVADKINTGTLNAAKVNIINLDALNITTGYISSQRIQAGSITADKLTADAIMVGFNQIGKTMNLSATELQFNSNGKKTMSMTEKGIDYYLSGKHIGYVGSHNWDVNQPSSSKGMGLYLSDGDFLSLGTYNGLQYLPYFSMVKRSAAAPSGGGVGINLLSTIYMRNNQIRDTTIVNAGFNGDINIMSAAHFTVSTNTAAVFNTNINMTNHTIYNQSSHSLKENFEIVSDEKALQNILETDILKYTYKNSGVKSVGLVINDDGKSPYKVADDLVIDGKYRNDSILIGYLMASVKALNKKIVELEMK